MRWSEFNVFKAEILATALLLLISASAALAQTSADQNAVQQNGMQPNGTQPNGMPPGAMPPDGMQVPAPEGPQNSQQMAEHNIYSNLRRNIYVETELSKMVEKRSGNADLKKFADQVITDNRQLENEVTLPVSSDGGLFMPEVPSQTEKAEKQMKKLSGPQFDQVYLVQMDAYVKDDEQVAARASSMTGSSDLDEAGMRTRTLADQRAKEISQLTTEENFKIQ